MRVVIAGMPNSSSDTRRPVNWRPPPPPRRSSAPPAACSREEAADEEAADLIPKGEEEGDGSRRATLANGQQAAPTRLQEEEQAAEQYVSSTTVQSLWRGVLMRRAAAAARSSQEARRLSMEVASVRVQSLSRRQRAQLRSKQLRSRIRDMAATILWARVRAHLARRRAKTRRALHRQEEERLVAADRESRDLSEVVTRRVARGATNSQTDRRGRLANLLLRRGSSGSPTAATATVTTTTPGNNNASGSAANNAPRVEAALPTAQIAEIGDRIAIAAVSRVESYHADRDGPFNDYAVATFVPEVPHALAPSARVAPALEPLPPLPPTSSSPSPSNATNPPQQRTQQQPATAAVVAEEDGFLLAVYDDDAPTATTTTTTPSRGTNSPPTTTPTSTSRRPNPPLPSAPPPPSSPAPDAERAVLRTLRESSSGGSRPSSTRTLNEETSTTALQPPQQQRFFASSSAPSRAASSSSNAPTTTTTSSRPSTTTEERIAAIAELSANGASVEARRGALALLADEYIKSPPTAECAPICAILALVRPLYDEDTSVRVAAVQCAQRLGSLEVAQFALDDESLEVRRAVVAALTEDTPPSLTTTNNGTAATATSGGRVEAIQSIQQQRLVTLIVSLMKALEDVNLDEELLVSAAKSLRDAVLRTRVTTPSLLAAPLEKGIEAQRAEVVRIALVVAAGELRAVETLSRIAIFDRAVNVRRAAVEMLGWNQAAQELRELVLAGDDDARVRADALEWLERLDDAQGLATRGVLGDKSAELRARSAHHLGDVAARRLEGCAPKLLSSLSLSSSSSSNTTTRRVNLPLPCEAPAALADVSGYRAPRRSGANPSWPTWYEGVTGALGRALTSDGNAGVRAAAATQLARLRGVTWLANGLRDAQTHLRLKCVELLGDLGREDAVVEALQRGLRDTDETVRRRTMERLGSLGDPRRYIDAVAASDASERNRLCAVKWLEQLERPGALAEKFLVDSTSAAVRVAAATALDRLYTATTHDLYNDIPACRAALLVRLGDTERAVRVASARALTPLGEAQWREMVRGDEEDCSRLGTLVPGAKGTAVLVSILCDAAELADRISAAQALAARKQAPRLATEALCACCAAARVLPASLRVAALTALQTLAATPGLNYPNPEDEAQLDAALRASFADKEHDAVRVAAAHAAGAARCSTSVYEQGLLRHLRPSNESVGAVRAACAARLACFGFGGGHQPLKTAAWALLDALRDRDLATREAASRSFAAFREAKFAPELAQRAATTLRERESGSSGSSSAQQQRGEYLESSSVTRATAARALGRLREVSALEALHEALAKDREPMVRRAVCAALGEIRHPRSLKPLLAPLRDKRHANVIEAAADAVSKIDYSGQYLHRGETVLRHAPIFKRKQKLWTSFKALVMTDSPRLFYVDADTLKAKDCDVHTLVVDSPDQQQQQGSPSSSGSSRSSKDLAFTVPGQGRVRVTLLHGDAAEWIATRGHALQLRRRSESAQDLNEGGAIYAAYSTAAASVATSPAASGSTSMTTSSTPTTNNLDAAAAGAAASGAASSSREAGGGGGGGGLPVSNSIGGLGHSSSPARSIPLPGLAAATTAGAAQSSPPTPSSSSAASSLSLSSSAMPPSSNDNPPTSPAPPAWLSPAPSATGSDLRASQSSSSSTSLGGRVTPPATVRRTTATATRVHRSSPRPESSRKKPQASSSNSPPAAAPQTQPQAQPQPQPRGWS